MHQAPPLPTLTAIKSVPRFFGFGYAGWCQSALEVGGDFYDVLPISEHSLLLAVADVMGKGPGAALFAGTLRTLLHALVEPNFCPAASLDELNELMFEQLSQADMFITLQLAVANFHRRQLTVASAGHCPLLMSSPDRRSQTLDSKGMPLGVCAETTYTSETVPLPSFTSVLLYTDGVTEARNRAGTFFGQLRLENWLTRAAGENISAEQQKQSLLRELITFQGGQHGADDQTFLILSDETPRPEHTNGRPDSRWFLPWTYSRRSASATYSCR